MCSIRAVVGLGNPGIRYAETRHNIGFRVVQELAARCSLQWDRHGELLIAQRLDLSVVLAQPQTFMNRSGRAVEWLVDLLDVPTEAVLVVYDDVDLELGRLRLRRSGGAGTHNGMRDIVDRLGPELPRLRVGVAEPPMPSADLADYVLSPFSAEVAERVLSVVSSAADAVEAAINDGLTVAMNRFNGVVVCNGTGTESEAEAASRDDTQTSP